MVIKSWMWFLVGISVGALVLCASVLSTTKQVSMVGQRVTQKRKAAVTQAAFVKPSKPIGSQKEAHAAVGPPLPAESINKKPDAAFTLRLIGTSPSEVSGEAIALFEDPAGGMKYSVHIGEILQGRRVAAITRDAVFMEMGGRSVRYPFETAERLSAAIQPGVSNDPDWRPVIDQVFNSNNAMLPGAVEKIKSAIQPVSETERIVDRAGAWDAVGENPLQIMREASLAPAFEGMKLIGLRLMAVPDGGVLKQSGFESGDIIKELNGKSATNPQLLLEFSGEIRRTSVIEVKIERNGRPMTLTYRMQ